MGEGFVGFLHLLAFLRSRGAVVVGEHIFGSVLVSAEGVVVVSVGEVREEAVLQIEQAVVGEGVDCKAVGADMVIPVLH